MLEPAVVVLRLLQYLGVAILAGSSLFFVYALPATGSAAASGLMWPRRLVAGAAALLAAASLAGMGAQTAVMAGSLAEGLKPASLGFVASQTGLGVAALVRSGCAVAALAATSLLRPTRALWWTTALLGLVGALSIPWMGHGAATEGLAGKVHLVSDALHATAAAVWIGALAAFLGLALDRTVRGPEALRAYHAALSGFASVGTGAVLVLLATGLVNSWRLVGLDGVSHHLSSPYGRVLAAKLALFALMLGLAALNRYRLTPALGAALEGDESGRALSRLRMSLAMETATATAVLAAAAWLGVLVPIAAQ